MTVQRQQEEEEQRLMLPQQIEHYSSFVEETLKPDLAAVEHAARMIQEEIDDYKQLQERLRQDDDQEEEQRRRRSSSVMVDLGYGKVRCRARPIQHEKDEPTTSLTNSSQSRSTSGAQTGPSPSNTLNGATATSMMVFVDVGLGFHVQMSGKEAIVFSQKRIDFLSSNKLKRHQRKIVDIKDHILSATNILNELHRELNQ